MIHKTFARKVREKYGDTIDEFALRLGVHTKTVSSWEIGVAPQPQVMALLVYAYEHDLALKSDADQKYQDMDLDKLINHLMEQFDDTEQGLALRLGLTKTQILRLQKRTSVNKSTKRLILEAVVHPENFMKYPKSFSK